MLPLSGFLSFVKQNKLFKPSEKVLLAVSGGKDSVLMANLFNEAGLTFGIAHCNFGLRKEEADSDERFTAALAEEFNAAFHATRFDTDYAAKSRKISIQMAARELRYEWFEQIRIQFEYDYIALAHHQSDTTETILLNLTRGTGISGMHGILAKRDRLIRPLLFLKREEIDQIIINEKIAYREDSSNVSVKYARNKIRHEVIPKLKELNPHLDETFKANSNRFKELEDFLIDKTRELRDKLFRQQPSGEIHIAVSDLKQIKHRGILLYELFKPYGFSEAVLRDLANAWSNQPGKIFESPGHLLLLDREKLILKKKDKKTARETLIYLEDGFCSWASFNFKYILCQLEEVTMNLEDSHTAYFDADLLQFPLKLRHWNKGDYFYPFGMGGKKKLSDFFTGLKIPLTGKNAIPILENGNGDIIWVARYRSDERYKISSLTKKVIIFETFENNEH